MIYVLTLVDIENFFHDPLSILALLLCSLTLRHSGNLTRLKLHRFRFKLDEHYPADLSLFLEAIFNCHS